MRTSWVQGLDFSFDNPKSEIKNLQWLGLSMIAFVLAICGDMAQAQQSKKIIRIGYLSASDPTSDSARFAGIRLALRELGYIEARNILIEYRYGEGKSDRFPDLAAELVGLKVDIIVVSGGGRMIRAAMSATKTIPIVTAGRGIDPVEGRLVKSLASPGGNLTGVTLVSTELGGKRLELVKEAVPKIARVAVLYDPAIPSTVIEMKEDLPVAASQLKIDSSALGGISRARFR